jgi:putative flippase GtrA
MGTGGTAGAVQLTLLALLTRYGWDALAANVVAFLLAAQLNFALSVTLTWRDRTPNRSWIRATARRWQLFHGSIALMALVNLLTFGIARSFLLALPAALAGIAAGGVGNYLIGDRFVFRRTEEYASAHATTRSAA